MAYKKLAIVLGNCLFPHHERLEPDEQTLFFMAEDAGLCTHFKYHKHKLILFLSAMRSHADDLREKHKLKYFELNAQNKSWTYEEKLDRALEQYSSLEEVVIYDVEDHFFDQRIRDWCKDNKLQLTVIDSPGFVTTKSDYKSWQEENKPFMQNFYKWQRKRLGVLITEDGEPINEKWSFDEANRKSLPADITVPEQPQSNDTEHTVQVKSLVDRLFPDHPGSVENFNWSTTRQSVLYRLNDFLKERFSDFGPYEDAIDKDRVFLFHTVLSPYINMGLITPDELTDKVLEFYHENDTHFPSVEGLVRQIIGWREFMRGIYNNYDLQKNKFRHQRKLKDCWYDGTTGIPPVDDSIKKAVAHGYTHHIERLMILGNIMLMADVHPDEVYKWFMEMYVDSSDWVMAPNVYGMSQFAEGGIFATKPYISGSNYIIKMSNYKKGEWADTVDGLYWRFISNKRKLFEKNYRMGMMIGTLDKMKDEKKKYLFDKAEKWIDKVTYTS